MAVATQQLDALVDDLVARHGGARPVEQGEGDSFVAVFSTAHQALWFAAELQARVASDLPFRTRVALHSGVAQLRGTDNYMGPAVNRCARLRALAHGGQVLLSGAAAALVIDDLPSGVSLRDVGSHKLRDFDRHERVFQLVHADSDDVFPPLRDEALDSNLPATLTSFVARDDELAALESLLDDHRLVTLIGAGGCGKTRLAIEFGRRVASRFDYGVAWADAAPIGDGALLISCIASAIGVRESPIEPLLDTVTRELVHRQVLLLLDNCEHVIDAAADIVERILNASEGVRVIATSREPLGVPGEVSMRVPSLNSEASVRLFEDRARSAVADVAWGPSEQRDVVDICGRLDGIPLAIELAAARTRVLSTRQIAEGIADRFGLLAGGPRTALPRQRTLEASVEWSYRLLSDAERTLLSRLSVFAGGFDLDGARRVCAADSVDDGAVLDLLTALVDKSLVHVHEPSDRNHERRYGLLETIRHFARERLTDALDAEATRDRHLAYFLELAEATAPNIENGHDLGDVAALSRLEADLDNLRAARDWAQQRGDADRLLRLVAALWLFHEVRCDFDEATSWLRTALDGAPATTATRALALYGLGDISLFTGDLATVVSAGEEVVAIGESLDDPMIRMRGLMNLGWAAAFGVYRTPDWAIEVLSDIVASLHGGDHAWLETDAAIGLSNAAAVAGDLARAIDAGRMAVAHARRNASSPALVRSTWYLGHALALAGHVSEAERVLTESVALADDLDDSFFRAIGLASLGLVHVQLARTDEAIAYSRESLAVSQRSGNPMALAMASAVLAYALGDRGDGAAAKDVLEGAHEIFGHLEQAGLWFLIPLTAIVRAMTGGEGDLDEARAHLAATYDAVPRAGRALVALTRGWLERLAGDDAAAEAAFTMTLEDAAHTGAEGDVVAALHELGVSAERRGQLDRAVRLCAAAEAATITLDVEPRPRPAALGPRSDDCARLRAALGDEKFATEWTAGVGLSFDEATRFALRGKGGRRRPATGWESLTPTELDVVRYVVEGLTNPAIADRMFITRGTVKVHLSHVFTKLGVASRAELAAKASRRFETD